MKYFLIIFLALLSNSAFAQNPDSTSAFRVKVSGSGGQPVLFIPGFASSGAVWDSTKALFGDDYTTYTLTMAGFAGVPPQKNPTFAAWRNAIGTYMESHHLKNTIIVGHSIGGLFAMAIAAHYPQLVSKIIVVDALPFLAGLKRPGFKAKKNPDCVELVKRTISMSDHQFKLMQKMTVNEMVADSSKRNLVLGWSLDSDRRTLGKMYCSFLNIDLRKEIGKIKSPVLVLLENSFANIKPAVQKQYENLSAATLKYAPRGSHFLMFGAKIWYQKQLTKFINH